jgi:HNH endonuclease
MPRGNRTNHVRGSAHPRWNPGRIITEEGYVKVRVGVGHPLADPKGYAYEHLVVWRAAGKRLPKPHELLHHRDEDKANNRIDNLELITRKRHSQMHAAASERDAHGRFMERSAA